MVPVLAEFGHIILENIDKSRSAPDFSEDEIVGDSGVPSALSENGSGRRQFLPNIQPHDRLPAQSDGRRMSQSPAEAELSPASLAGLSQTPGVTGPLEWYDLLAQDAIREGRRQNLFGGGHDWQFDENNLSRRHSQLPESNHCDEQILPSDWPTSAVGPDGLEPSQSPTFSRPPWRTAGRICLEGDDLTYFRYYIDVIGPLLDLFDPAKHFTSVVPHLALLNVGLFKSCLATAARHKSICRDDGAATPSEPQSPAPWSVYHGQESATAATQYYYETLHYLSKTLSYTSYVHSHEILATAIMINTYEMFSISSLPDWDRHLRGAFWILRSQDNNGESVDGLRQAVWWAWLRQDTWAAFRQGRRTMTFWQPQKSLESLTADELASRMVYIAAKCVEYAGIAAEYRNGSDQATEYLPHLIEQAEKLFQALVDWEKALPNSFRPISQALAPVEQASSSSLTTLPTSSVNGRDLHKVPEPVEVFPPIWIHPPSHAAAMQTFHFARIVVLLNQPSVGGLRTYRTNRLKLDESIRTICGIANAELGRNTPTMFVSVQALYAGKSSRTRPPWWYVAVHPLLKASS